MLSTLLCTDILAIHCIKEHVCIGIGNCLHVFNIATRQLVAKLNALEHDNIHGIIEGPGNDLFVYGGKSLSTCKLEIASDTVRLNLSSAVQRFHDWIIAIQWTHHEDITELYILFAHNNLHFYNVATKKHRNFWCQEKCILYGGSLLIKNNRETVIFSGTVFQEILIWKVKNNLDYPNDVAILHRLKGHKGVIFSVAYDPILHIISSTSDDRTIRLWRVTSKALQETNEGDDWDNSKINLMTTMYGHTARVWRSVIKRDKIISIGEDSFICVWSIDGKLLHKVEAHRGAEIWSVDVSDDSKILLTGGADGAVNMWPFESNDSFKESAIFRSDEKKIPKHICFMNSGTIFVFLDGGTLVSYDPSLMYIKGKSLDLPRYSSYCIMEISMDRKRIGFASKDGYVEIYEEFPEGEAWNLRKILEINVCESKIFSLHWLSYDSIVVCADGGILKEIDVLNTVEVVRTEFVLLPSRERWTTAAVIYENLLICGDRAGSIHVFDSTASKMNREPIQIFPKIHGRLGVQSFTVIGNKILSTGRDGTLRFYKVSNDRTKQPLRSLHQKKMPMDWVCKVLKINDDLYVLGFKEVEFMVYSMNLKRLVQRFVCGGGHRSWDCTFTNDKLNFIYIRNKRVYAVDLTFNNVGTEIVNGFHSKETYCVERIVTAMGRNIILSVGEDCTMRISCIADAKSTIQRYRLKTLDTYDGHLSNVKTVSILNLANSENSTRNLVFTGGGRAQLKVWEITVEFNGGMLRELDTDSVTCVELTSFMLRGTDQDRRRTWQSVNPAFFVDPETRFMDISLQLYNRDQNFVILFVACSDGFMRILLYDIVKNNLVPSSVINSCNRCILKVHSFVHEDATISLTMTTDGIVSFWHVNTIVENLVKSLRSNEVETITTNSLPFAKIRIHQSGINSYDFRKLNDSQYLLLTGGDDNLISLIAIEIISINDCLSVHTLTKWNSSSIHSAQITGVKFVGNNRILSAGIDQRVILYSYSYIDGILSVSQIDETITSVPSVQGVTMCCSPFKNEETVACVYGKGLEVIILDRKT